MSEKTKNRTLRYRRIQWSGMINKDIKKNLEYHLVKAHKKLDTVQKRNFEHNEGEVQGVDYSIPEKLKGILVHIAYYVPNEDTSLIRKPSRNKTGKITTTFAPDGNDFMRGDIMFYLKKNNMIICTSGAKETLIKYYLNNMLKKAGLNSDTTKFSIERIANAKKIQLIQLEGVKAIHLKSSLYKASVDYMKRQTRKNKFLSYFAENFEAIFGIDDSDVTDKAAENLITKLEIRLDRRRKASLTAKRQIDAVAESLVEDDDSNFVIETYKNKRLTPDEIEINTKVPLLCHGSSVHCRHAWDELLSYYEELKSDGFLEQWSDPHQLHTLLIKCKSCLIGILV